MKAFDHALIFDHFPMAITVVEGFGCIESRARPRDTEPWQF